MDKLVVMLYDLSAVLIILMTVRTARKRDLQPEFFGCLGGWLRCSARRFWQKTERSWSMTNF